MKLNHDQWCDLDGNNVCDCGIAGLEDYITALETLVKNTEKFLNVIKGTMVSFGPTCKRVQEDLDIVQQIKEKM